MGGAMRTFTLLPPLAAAAILLAGCETMDRGQCALADWRQVGVTDGAAGRSLDYFERRQKDCGKHGIAADADAYRAGREDGLVQYCTPARGFRAGVAGEVYGGVCPFALEPGFMTPYRDGKRFFDATGRLSQVESDISSAESRLRDLEDDIDKAERELGAPNISAEERTRLTNKLGRLREERGFERGKRTSLEKVRVDYSEEVARLRGELSARYGAW